MQHGIFGSKTNAYDSLLPVDTRAWQRGLAPVQRDPGLNGSKTLWQNFDTNHYLTMKNPLKQQTNNVAASAQARLSQTAPMLQQPSSDQPFELAAPQNRLENHPSAPLAATRELRSPEAESFRAFLKSRLPREKASPALLDKIRHTTKTPA